MTHGACPDTNNTLVISSLKQRADFLRLNQSKTKWISKNLVIQSAAIPEDTADHPEKNTNTDTNNPHHIRVGFTVTKKTFKSAVKRNRVKRRLRALAQEILATQAKAGQDYVLIGRPATLDAPYDTLKKDLKWCLKRMDLKR